MTVEIERLAVVETEVKNVKDAVNRVEIKIDALAGKFANKEDIVGLETRIKTLEDKNVWKSAALIVTTASSIILAVLLAYKELNP